MAESPRPTREQVEADLAWADDRADTADSDRVQRLAAEVRALRDEVAKQEIAFQGQALTERWLRAELAARTPRPAEQARRDDLARDVARAYGKVHRLVRAFAGDDLADALDRFVAPQPAVPDGEDRLNAMIGCYDAEVVAHGRTRRDLDRLQGAVVDVLEAVTELPGLEDAPNDRLVIELRRTIQKRPDGEAVPARLEAAADTLSGIQDGLPRASLLVTAAVLRRILTEDGYCPPEARAAVAAALAGGAR